MSTRAQTLTHTCISTVWVSTPTNGTNQTQAQSAGVLPQKTNIFVVEVALCTTGARMEELTGIRG